MSCNSSWRIARRHLCIALAAWPLAGRASVGEERPIDGFKRWGSGEFRRLGFLVYEATLWAGGDDPLRPPLALDLLYRRALRGKSLADASVREMRRLGFADDANLAAWGEQLVGIFPDVRPGDRILGLHRLRGAQFFHNDRPIGALDDGAFASAFFAIWLDERTSAPELRAVLLKRPAA
jgi:hypothetical protein